MFKLDSSSLHLPEGVRSTLGPWWRARAPWQALAAASTALLLLILQRFDSGFWMNLDERLQYAPVYMDIGRRLRAGEWLPIIDPDLGVSGNYSLDIQYGLFEPTHWVVAIVLSNFQSFALAGFVWALVYLMIFALGTACLTLRLGVAGLWAAAAGLAAATSGYLFFRLATPWIPGVMSIAWVPWFWWAWVGLGKRLAIRQCIAIAIFSYLVIASGWPSTWMIFGALVVGLCIEAALVREAGSRAVDWLVPLGLRGAATLAGAVSAALTVLPLAAAAQYTNRQLGLDNVNVEVPNVADILGFSSPQLHGDLLTTLHNSTYDKPIYFAVWFGVVILWLVPWRIATLRSRGVVTAMVGCAVMLLLTQAPSTFGPIRDQIRQLAGVQFFFAVLVCVLACAAPLVVSRGRLVGIAASLVAVAWLTFARDPGSAATAVAAVVGVGLLAALMVWALTARGLKLAAVVALIGTAASTGLAFGLSQAAQPSEIAANTLVTGSLNLDASDRPIFAVYPKGKPKDWKAWTHDGVGRALSNLSAQVRLQPGYSSIGQKAFLDTFCVSAAHGNGCSTEGTRLLKDEPTTHQPWVNLLGYRTVVVATSKLQHAFVQGAGKDWHKVKQGRAFAMYKRKGPSAVAGRVTDVIGHASVQAVTVDNGSQSYDVTSPNGARLVFRDLYWPGYVATLDGTQLPISPLDNMLVTVNLPAGSHGLLQVSYQPLPLAALVGLPVFSLLLLGGACAGAVIWRRRRSAGVHRDAEADEPNDREPLEDPV